MATIDVPRPAYMETEELGMFADMVARFLADHATPAAIASWRDGGMVPRELWRAAGEAGLLGVSLPEEYGGSCGDFRFDVVIMEALGRANALNFAIPLHGAVIAPYIAQYGAAEQKARYLPCVASGETILAIAMTEPSAGSDLRGMRTRAQRDGDDYVINGQKTFISNGRVADVVIVAAKTDPKAGAKGISLFIVDADTPGFTRGPLLHKLGQDGRDTVELFFSDMRVPAANLLGREGGGFAMLMAKLPQERLVIAWQAMAMMEAALETTIAYVKDRRAFGGTLFDFQNTQFKLAECKTQATIAKVFLWDCTARLLAGTLDAATASMAKLWITETQARVIDECLQLHGGYGYMAEYPISDMYRDARGYRIYGGANEIMKLLIALNRDAMTTPYIIDAVRTPMARGKPGGALSAVHPVELLAMTLKALIERSGVDPGAIDDVLIGCVSQVGEQSNNPGRMALLAAGFPNHVPATTIERKCGSSQQAIHFAAQGIAAGAYDLVIAGGIESMSRIPMGSARIGMDIFGPTLNAIHAPGLVSQGVAAELVARKWGISRADMDAYSAESHRRAEATRASGGFDAEIVAIDAAGARVERDETIRPGASREGLAGLKAVFATEEMSARFPQVEWGVTSGNSSQLTDGASAVLLASEGAAKRLGLTPRARFVAFDVIGDDPMLMLTAPIPATRRVLAKAGLAAGDIDHFEVNEAFASVPLAWAREFPVAVERLNPRGGAIALGHPLGASGARLMTTMLNGLEQTGGRYGLQTMCEAGGMANATIIERI